MAMIPMEYGGGNSFGTSVDLTSNVNYTCPSDGYFRVQCTSGSANYVLGYIEDTLMINTGGVTSINPCVGTFVKQGMTLKYTGSTGSSGKFYPLV